MMEYLEGAFSYIDGISPALVPIALIIGFVALSSVVNFILRKVAHLTSKTESTLDDDIIRNMKNPIRAILALTGFFLAAYYLDRELTIYDFSLVQIFQILTILVVAYTIAKISNTLFDWYMARRDKAGKVIDKGIIPLVRKFMAIFIYIMAFIAIVAIFKIEVTPVLAGLGIGGIAIALAAQDTLSGFFSGLYITVDRPIKIGDYIESEGTAGYVTDIGWRSTKIMTLGKNLIIIPNKKLADSVIKNYDAPLQEISVIAEVGIAYASDLEKTEKVTIDAAKRVIEANHDEAIQAIEPVVRFIKFADSSINLRIIIKAKNYAAQFKLMHELIKEVHKTYRKENIEIPFPQMDVHMGK